MAKIVTLTDKYNNVEYPRTKAGAVYVDDNGTMLSSLLTSILEAIGGGGISFTEAQRNAINSGITSALVGELARLCNLRISFSNNTLTIWDAAAGEEKSYPLGTPVTYTYGNPTLTLTYPTEIGVNGDVVGLSTFAVTQVVTGSDSSTRTLSFTSLSDFLAAGGEVSFTLDSDYDTFSINDITGVITVEPNSVPVDKTAVVTVTVYLHGKSASVDSSTITQDASAAAGDDEVMITLGYFDGCSSSMGTMSGDGAVGTGVSTTVTATPESGYEFAGWYSSVNSNLVSADASYTFVPETNITLYARFAEESSSDVETEVTFDDLGAYDFTTNSPTLVSSNTYHVYYAYMPAGYGMYINGNSSVELNRLTSTNTQFNVGTLDNVPTTGSTVTPIISNWRIGKLRYFVPPSEVGKWVVVKLKPSGGFADFTANLVEIASSSVVDVSTDVGTVSHNSSTEGTYFDDESIYSVTYANFTVKYLLVEANTIANVVLTGVLSAQNSSSSYKILRFGAAAPKDSDNNNILDIPSVGDSTISDELVRNPVYRASTTQEVTLNFAFPAKSYARYVLIQGDFEATSQSDDAWTGIAVTKYTLE